MVAKKGMTEEEWRAGDDLSAMYGYVQKRARGQKRPLPHREYRLFGCACCRLVWELLADERSRGVVEVAERFADGEAKKSELARADRAAAEVAVALKLPREPRGLVARGKHPPQLAAEMAVWAGSESIQDVVEMTTITAECLVKVLEKRTRPGGEGANAIGPLRRLEALFREVFGNPFRPADLAASCRNPAVASLARSAYEERLPDGRLAGDRLAVLSDALEEAGCDDASVLDHLRDPGPHFRGCWAVDLVLAKR